MMTLVQWKDGLSCKIFWSNSSSNAFSKDDDIGAMEKWKEYRAKSSHPIIVW